MINYDFRGRIGIVAGAGSGIGQGALVETANEAAKLDGKVVPRAIDVTNESQHRAAIAEAESTFGPVSFLFSNAGISGAHKALVDLSLDELDAI